MQMKAIAEATAPIDEPVDRRAGEGTEPAEHHPPVVYWLREVDRADVLRVGGKGANLGELSRAGFPVPPAFIVSVDAYWRFRESSGVGPALDAALRTVTVDDAAALQSVSSELRELVEESPFPASLADEIVSAYRQLSGDASAADASVAVRSSATAEDTAQFSFAGMFESFLNVHGQAELLQRVKSCWASTFHARVLFYRLKQGMPAEMPVAVVVQRMVGGDKAGVMFTVDPASRNRDRIVIEAAWGLGEVVVLGQVTPDRYVLVKDTLDIVETSIGDKEFMLVRDTTTGATKRVDLANDPRGTARVLTDDELRSLGELGRRAETHYRAPQDMEFAVEGDTIYLTQARPVTTIGVAPGDATSEEAAAPEPAEILARGLGASPGIAVGPVRVLAGTEESGQLEAGEILVARMTSPDWVPLMRRASAVVTDAGGMTSHAAIVSRELGIPCVVGAHDATRTLTTGTVVTVDGTRGTVAAGEHRAPLAVPVQASSSLGVSRVPLVTATKLYVNLGEPERAEAVAQLDVDGVGLLRAEFMLMSALEGTHPRKLIAEGRGDEIVERMTEKLRMFAQAFAPRPVVYRTMDFRSNEFRGLTGGEEFEAPEENPMIGYRGCYRYIREPDLFALELSAVAAVRREFPNVHLMIPFVRTAWEFRECKRLIDASPLGADRSLQLWVMAEVPSVAYWLEEYVRAGATGVSIGSNDLTQLVLGVDRDSESVAPLFDERDGAVLDAIRSIIVECHRLGVTCSICGQAPSVHSDFAEHLVRWGIDSISVNPDVVEITRRNIAAAEQRILLDNALARGQESSGDDNAPSQHNSERPGATISHRL
jgi:pyruvate,water dikinase